MSFTAVLLNIIVNIMVIAPLLWISGRLLVGKEKAKFTDAISVVVLSVILSGIVNFFVGGLLAALIMFIVILALIKHFFDCGWLRAFAISIFSAIIFLVVLTIMAIIGIGVLRLLL
ncbi:MAG: hypothetical protein NO482_04060 [Candidatus Methanomethylicia archaeon]|jgi:hypothetical protein|nr:hypothetical protein [Candidatus Methanomethylicia archaeon]